jgi:hypothetical protein
MNARVYTVLDVMPLRMAGKFMADVRACGFVMRVPPGRRLPPIAAPQMMLPPASAPVPPMAGAPLVAPTPRVPSPAEIRDAQNAMEARYGRLSQLFRAEHAEPTEADFLEDWRRLSDAETQRKRRKPPPDEMVPFYVRLPVPVVLASRPFAPWVNPLALPRVPNLRITWEKDRWLPSEDALLAAGIRNYGVRWDVIRVNLLPAKTARQIINRQKNLCNETRFKGENVVRDAKQKVLQPLSAAEIRKIREVLHRDDAVAGRENWDAIQRECLPNRNASCLDRLWKEAHPRGLVACEPYPEPGAPLLLASAERVGTAPIDMINASFHDHNVSIHVPRKAKRGLDRDAAAEPARFHPSLFGGAPEGADGSRRGESVVSGEKGVRDARLPPASRARRKRTRRRRRPRALRPAGGLARPRGEPPPRVWAVRERRRAFVAGGGGDAARDGSRALFALEGPRRAPVAPEGSRGDARRAGPGQPEQPERGAHAQQGGGLRAGGSARHGQRRRRRRFARRVGAARPGSAEPRGYVRGEGDAGPRGARRG